MLTCLTDAQIEKALVQLGGWEFRQDRQAIFRRFVFYDFKEAIGFMMQVAMAADAADHHPEWCNVYNKVHIWLTTHDVDGVSQRDLDLSIKINDIFKRNLDGK